jgi:ornithine lipid hydroxylase
MDFFRYWYHRWMHETPFMWRWHSVHHSSPRLYWFNGARSHPLEQFVNGIIWVVPYTLIQAPAETVLVAGIIGRVIGRFQHTNADVQLGPLEYVFSAPNNHRYHHSKLVSEGNSNYGGDIILWDLLFGTFHLPKGKSPSDDIGVANPDYPQDWLGLMLAPFRIKMWRRPADKGSEQPDALAYPPSA